MKVEIKLSEEKVTDLHYEDTMKANLYTKNLGNGTQFFIEDELSGELVEIVFDDIFDERQMDIRDFFFPHLHE